MEKKKKDSSTDAKGTVNVAYPTGFFEFDTQNGYRVLNSNTGEITYRMGIIDGSVVGFTGRSGIGKSTISMQIAGNIVSRFENGNILHFDLEQGCSNDEKNMRLLKMNREAYLKKYERYNSNITMETFEKRIMEEYHRKLNSPELMYDTGLKDFAGNSVYKYEPTIVILDSYGYLVTDKMLAATEMQLTDGMTNAGALHSMFKRLIQRIRDVNIILMIILPKRDNINMKFYAQKSDMQGLNNDEKIPGGSTMNYILSYLIKIDDGTKFSHGEEFGFGGFYGTITAAKTREGSLKNVTKVIFNSDNMGIFDENISNFLYLHTLGVITQSGAYYTMPGFDKKFTKKNVVEFFKTNEEFVNTFNGLLRDAIRENIREFIESDDDSNIPINTYKNINAVLSLL